MYLETVRMILREFTTDDIDDFHEIFSDPVVMEHTEPPYDKEESLQFLTSFCIKRKPKGGFAAVLRETGKVIGYVLFKSIDEPEIYEIGWIFNKDYWGKGYASEICSRLVQHGFEDMKLHKICAEATDGNKSVSLMKKLGMKQEGVQNKHSKSRTDEWLDLYWYAVLAEDYFKSVSVKKTNENDCIANHFTATGIVFNKSGEILMIKHKKLGVWLPPGGHVDVNELPCETVLREIFEETGVTAEIITVAQDLGTPTDSCELPLPMQIKLEDIEGTGLHNHIDMIYLCLADNQKLNPQVGEIDDIGWFTPAAVMGLDTFDNVRNSVQKALRFMESRS